MYIGYAMQAVSNCHVRFKIEKINKVEVEV